MIDMFGGFVFLGTIVSITLLIGIFLMMYYKQVSEGFEDHRNYQIMKKWALINRSSNELFVSKLSGSLLYL